MKCKLCNKEIHERGLSTHLKSKHSILMKDYYDKFIKKEDEGICPVCKKETKFLGPKKGYREYCSTKCANLDPKTKAKLEKYYMNKYGVKNPMQSKEIKDKYKQTCKSKYGVENVSQVKEIKDKKSQTCLKNNGVKHPQQSIKIRKKSKKTCLINYDVTNPSQSKVIKKRKEQTSLNNYGVKHPMQNSLIYEKHKQKSYQYKNYKLPSGKIIKIQGYESFALDLLLKKYNEKDIIIDVSKMPKITYTVDNKEHRYYPDIYIKSVSKFIEVKSKYTYNVTKKINLIKKEAVLNNGYLFEFYIFDKKGNLI